MRANEPHEVGSVHAQLARLLHFGRQWESRVRVFRQHSLGRAYLTSKERLGPLPTRVGRLAEVGPGLWILERELLAERADRAGCRTAHRRVAPCRLEGRQTRSGRRRDSAAPQRRRCRPRDRRQPDGHPRPVGARGRSSARPPLVRTRARGRGAPPQKPRLAMRRASASASSPGCVRTTRVGSGVAPVAHLVPHGR